MVLPFLSSLPTAWLITLEVLYVLFIIAVCLRIVWDTRSVSKTLAYLLLVIFLPVIGVIFYFSFGINYRKRKIYNKKLIQDEALQLELEARLDQQTNALLHSNLSVIEQHASLIKMLSNPKSGHYSPISIGNKVTLLNNGEKLFPKIKEAILQAKHHIHIEFYIYEDDQIGNELKELLMNKAKEGVEVRFIYDDFGSKGIRGRWIRAIKRSGVEAYPFNRIYWIALANRLNYRNHRKILVIDGHTAFVGGINVSDKYINNGKQDLYWRDTHIRLEGSAVHALQHIFLSDWNFCSNQEIGFEDRFFPKLKEEQGKAVQVVSSGPDSDVPAILNGMLYAISQAKNEILLTTPYYIPDEQLQQNLILAALSGVEVKLLVPKDGDSWLINIVAQTYFEELLKSGVKIYQYHKGFIHAKSFVIDGNLSSVGTANMDLRSFDLNFEVTAFIYDDEFGAALRSSYFEDLQDASELQLEKWLKRSKVQLVLERLLRLFAPLM